MIKQQTSKLLYILLQYVFVGFSLFYLSILIFSPQQLELTGVNEQILMDNLDVFKKNGFTFDINEEAAPTKRVKLLTLPMSKNWVFGKADIEELLFMLRVTI